jgi:hypothetical protein
VRQPSGTSSFFPVHVHLGEDDGGDVAFGSAARPGEDVGLEGPLEHSSSLRAGQQRPSDRLVSSNLD